MACVFSRNWVMFDWRLTLDYWRICKGFLFTSPFFLFGFSLIFCGNNHSPFQIHQNILVLQMISITNQCIWCFCFRLNHDTVHCKILMIHNMTEIYSFLSFSANDLVVSIESFSPNSLFTDIFAETLYSFLFWTLVEYTP